VTGPRRLDGPFFRWSDPAPYSKHPPESYGEVPDLVEATVEVSRRRNLDCARYCECLTHAANHGWRGFECCRCEAFPGATVRRLRVIQ
jgi:hypothetical protein